MKTISSFLFPVAATVGKSMVCSMALFLVASLSVAQAESFGSWSTGRNAKSGTVYAVTMNDSGDVFGEYCFASDSSCVWLLGTSTGCKIGSSYPVLANSDAGAASLGVYCADKLHDGTSSYAFTDFKTMQNIVERGTKLGIALPLLGDHFRVLRFALGGSNRAISVMEAEFDAEIRHHKSAAPSRGTGTSDEDF